MAQQHQNPKRRPQEGGNSNEDDKLDEKKIKSWIQVGIDKDLIEFADDFGKKIQMLTTSQIRIVFGEMRRIQMNEFSKEKTSFILLKPKLAYAKKRHNNDGIKKFYKFFCYAYDAVDTQNDENGKKHFENFMNLMEAVLAYHKYHGGKE